MCILYIYTYIHVCIYPYILKQIEYGIDKHIPILRISQYVHVVSTPTAAT